jgi:glycosyltransferase involved in cell wall biosynthesis
MMDVPNIFYEEPDGDRWLTFDRYPRRLVRHLVHGPTKPSGQMRVFLNLCAGLDKLGLAYRLNDYRHLRRHPKELVCVIGKPCVLKKMMRGNPILFGASVFSHPIEDPNLLKRLPVKLVLVPGEWMRQMFEPYYGEKVVAWPVGIDTDRWAPASEVDKEFEFLIYDKVRWEHDRYEKELIEPIRQVLQRQTIRFSEIRYGHYKEEDYHSILKRCKAMIFLCEHETQGIAYQQALSMDIPILAWDRGGYWKDPAYYPHKVKFEPVSSVPYWDERCGVKFTGISEFDQKLEEFIHRLNVGQFAPRDYVVENLELADKAREYLKIVQRLQAEA